MQLFGSKPFGPQVWRVIAILAIVALAVTACVTQIEQDPTAAEPAAAAATSVPAEEAAGEAAAAPTEAPAAEAAAPAAAAPTLEVAAAIPGEETYKGLPVGFTEDGLPYRGEPDAPIVMIEYSDFACPFCNRYFVQTEPAFDESYVRTGQVRVVFHDLPLESLHPNAPAAHIASLCVAEQGSAARYWEMHAELFRAVEEWQGAADPLPIFARLAEESGADMAAYEACMAAGEQAAIVQERVDLAMARGFSGTPSFQFVRQDDNVVFELVGAQPYEQFAAVVDNALAGAMPQPAQPAADAGQPQEGIPFWATAEGLAPDPDRPGFNIAGDQYRGSLDAPLTVIEFSDFQCPYCRQHVADTQPALDEAFVETGKVLWVFKHFPLNIHPQAPQAGVAAECAAEQGQFWEMHHLLFENVDTWSIADPFDVMVGLAEQLELDTEAFGTCLRDPEIAARVQSDLDEGMAFVRGTPTFIILRGEQGSIIPGALPVERFTEILNEELAAAEAAQ
jgi:protein-disulfide isomerase